MSCSANSLISPKQIRALVLQLLAQPGQRVHRLGDHRVSLLPLVVLADAKRMTTVVTCCWAEHGPCGPVDGASAANDPLDAAEPLDGLPHQPLAPLRVGLVAGEHLAGRPSRPTHESVSAAVSSLISAHTTRGAVPRRGHRESPAGADDEDAAAFEALAHRLAGVTPDSPMAALAAERSTVAMHTARPQRAATSKLVTASWRRSTRAAPCRRLAMSVASSIDSCAAAGTRLSSVTWAA